MREVLFILLGWVLGLASPLILDANRKRRDQEDLKQALATELEELRYRLAGTVYLIEARFGTFNRELILWLKSIQDAHLEIHPDERAPSGIDQLSKADPKDFAVAASRIQEQERQSGRALYLKQFEIPFVGSQIGHISGLPKSLQQTILEIRSRLTLTNAEIEQVQEYFRMTFTLEERNHDIANANLREASKHVAEQSRRIIDRITEMLPRLTGRH